MVQIYKVPAEAREGPPSRLRISGNVFKRENADPQPESEDKDYWLVHGKERKQAVISSKDTDEYERKGSGRGHCHVLNDMTKTTFGELPPREPEGTGNKVKVPVKLWSGERRMIEVHEDLTCGELFIKIWESLSEHFASQVLRTSSGEPVKLRGKISDYGFDKGNTAHLHWAKKDDSLPAPCETCGLPPDMLESRRYGRCKLCLNTTDFHRDGEHDLTVSSSELDNAVKRCVDKLKNPLAAENKMIDYLASAVSERKTLELELERAKRGAPEGGDDDGNGEGDDNNDENGEEEVVNRAEPEAGAENGAGAENRAGAEDGARADDEADDGAGDEVGTEAGAGAEAGASGGRPPAKRTRTTDTVATRQPQQSARTRQPARSRRQRQTEQQGEQPPQSEGGMTLATQATQATRAPTRATQAQPRGRQRQPRRPRANAARPQTVNENPPEPVARDNNDNDNDNNNNGDDDGGEDHVQTPSSRARAARARKQGKAVAPAAPAGDGNEMDICEDGE